MRRKASYNTVLVHLVQSSNAFCPKFEKHSAMSPVFLMLWCNLMKILWTWRIVFSVSRRSYANDLSLCLLPPGHLENNGQGKGVTEPLTRALVDYQKFPKGTFRSLFAKPFDLIVWAQSEPLTEQSAIHHLDWLELCHQAIKGVRWC